MLLPFLSGFLGCYERVLMNSGTIKELGRKRVRLLSLFFTTVILFIPAVISMLVFEVEGDSVSYRQLGWPLANTVVFGVLLSENFSDERIVNSKELQRNFVITFACTLILELFYFPELSLWGLLVCGLLLWIAVKQLDPLYWDYLELGLESADSLTTSVTKVVRHILNERKSRKIALFLLINTCYMVVEFVVGFMSNSLGLISDACHMLFDCAALAIGLYASYISRLPANNQFNYGRGRFEVLSGYVNAVFLVLVGALIVVESLERILDPQEISTNSLLTVSIGGLLVNIVGLIFFHEEHHHAHGGSSSCSHQHHHDEHQHHHNEHQHHDKHQHHHDEHQHHHDEHQHHHDEHQHHHDEHQHHHDEHQHHHDEHHHDHHDRVSGSQGHGHGDHDHVHHHNDNGHIVRAPELDQKKKHQHRHVDHNMEGIFLHVLADTMGSVGVVLSTLLIQYKGWLAADPACSIFISVMIISSVIPLLRNSAEILLQRIPRGREQELNEALKDIMKIKGVKGIQNLHIWSLTNNDVVGTLRLHVSADTNKDHAKALVLEELRSIGVKDLTIQVECGKG
jgi:zinc transporter 5/7